MAKGDHDRVSNEIDAQRDITQPGLDQLHNQTRNTYDNIMPQWQDQYQRDMADRSSIMDQYKQFGAGVSNMGGGGAGLSNQDDVNFALKGYRNFADTGGFSNNDIASMKEQNFAPSRAAYQRAIAGLQTNRGLLGGYSPNYAASAAKMQRSQGQQMSDSVTNTNAALARLIQEGKIAGLGGVSNTALANQAAGLQAAAINNQFRLGTAGMGLQSINGQAGLYGTAPGASGQLFQDVLGAQGQQLQAQGLQNNWGQTMINARLGLSNVPGNFQQAMGNIGTGMGLFGAGAGMLNNFTGANPGMNGGGQPGNNYARPYPTNPGGGYPPDTGYPGEPAPYPTDPYYPQPTPGVPNFPIGIAPGLGPLPPDNPGGGGGDQYHDSEY